MKCPHRAIRPSASCPAAREAFTLIELLAVIAIIAVLAAILLPALSSARERSRGLFCLNNTRQLTLAWELYADDHGGALPYNLAMDGSSFRTNINWVNNVMTWDLSSDNTNPATITGASLGPYVGGVTGIFHCPSDTALSAAQMAAGWRQRIRSYSMNAMVGNAGAFSTTGVNVNNPHYRQFFKLEQRDRLAKQIALKRVTTMGFQEVPLRFRFHSLGQHIQPQRLGHRDYHHDDGRIIRVGSDVVHERLVYLELVERQPLEVLQR